MARVINVTPHPIVLHLDGCTYHIQSAGVARVSEIREEAEPVTFRPDLAAPLQIPVARVGFGPVEGLPEPQSVCRRCGSINVLRGPLYPCDASQDGYDCDPEDTIFVVSSLVRSACPERTDLVSPDTSAGAVRDDAGRIVGTRGFVR